MNNDITGAIIIHNDASLLKQTLETVKEFVDKLVIVDGAYSWVAPFCEQSSELPDRSTDGLHDILLDSKIPYEYYNGIWESETQKRIFSIEKASTNIVVNIDSDELFDIKQQELVNFINSNKPLGRCLFPLYFTPSLIGVNEKTGSPPFKEIFINKKFHSAKNIVDSMFLAVPEEERSSRLTRDNYFEFESSVIHHISNFRRHPFASRRGRFYTLLSMRISRQIGLLGKTFKNDKELLDILQNLNEKELHAFSNFYKFQRIAASHPALKNNQILSPALNSPEFVEKIIIEAYKTMLESQEDFLNSLNKKDIYVFSGRELFIDVTNFSKSNGGISLIHGNSVKIRSFLVYRSKNGDKETMLQPLQNENNTTLNIPSFLSNDDRHLLKLIIDSPNKIEKIKFELHNS